MKQKENLMNEDESRLTSDNHTKDVWFMRTGKFALKKLHEKRISVAFNAGSRKPKCICIYIYNKHTFYQILFCKKCLYISGTHFYWILFYWIQLFQI